MSKYSEPSQIGDSSRPSKIDSGLTKEDVMLLRNTWTYMESQELVFHVGADLFITLFHDCPPMMNYFESFNLKKVMPKMNERLGRHALIFMDAIKDLLDRLEETEDLMELLNKIAQAHMKRGVSKEDMRTVTSLFINILKNNLAEQFTPETEEAWTKLLDFVNNLYSELMEKDIMNPPLIINP